MLGTADVGCPYLDWAHTAGGDGAASTALESRAPPLPQRRKGEGGHGRGRGLFTTEEPEGKRKAGGAARPVSPPPASSSRARSGSEAPSPNRPSLRLPRRPTPDETPAPNSSRPPPRAPPRALSTGSEPAPAGWLFRPQGRGLEAPRSTAAVGTFLGLAHWLRRGKPGGGPSQASRGLGS